MDVYFSLGSNLGDRENNLKEAIARMEEAFRRPPERVSSFIETEAWRMEGEPFLNCVVLFKIRGSRKDPESSCRKVLHCCKEIERAMGRRDNPQYDNDGNRIYASRPIDIDILFYGLERIETEDLIVPHKDMCERDFVMVPLREIAGESVRKAFGEIFGAK